MSHLCKRELKREQPIVLVKFKDVLTGKNELITYSDTEGNITPTKPESIIIITHI